MRNLHRPSRRKLLGQGLGLSLAGAFGTANAQWSGGPALRMIVPFSPASAVDIVARLVSTRLSQVLQQNVVVENIAGAGGVIGTGTAANARPDGNTVLMQGISYTITPQLHRNAPYSLAQFRPLLRTAEAPMVIVRNPGFGPATLAELVTHARQSGQPFFYASSGNGTILHLVMEMLRMKGKFPLNHVPYKGVSQMVTDVLGNQVPLAAAAVASVLPHLQSGALKAIAITGSKRSALLPDVPTVAQTAGFEGFDVAAWNGLLAPAGTPDAAALRLQKALASVLDEADTKAALQKQGLESAPLEGAAFEAFLKREYDNWGEVIREAGVVLQ